MTGNCGPTGSIDNPRDSSTLEWLGLPLIPAAAGAAACGLGVLAGGHWNLDPFPALAVGAIAAFAAVIGVFLVLIPLCRTTAVYGAPWGYFVAVFISVAMNESGIWTLLIIVGLPFAIIIWLERHHAAAVIIGMLAPPLALGGAIATRSPFAQLIIAGVLAGSAFLLLLADKLKARKG